MKKLNVHRNEVWKARWPIGVIRPKNTADFVQSNNQL